MFSFVVLLALGATFLLKVMALQRIAPEEAARHEQRAWDVFKFSVLYLALFFMCLVVDSLFV